MAWLDQVVFGNRIGVWLAAGGTAVLVWVLLRVMRAVLVPRLARLAERIATPLHVLLLRLGAGTHGTVIAVVALAVGGLVLSLSPGIGRFLRFTLAAAVLFQLGLWGSVLITYAVTEYGRRRLEQDPATVTTISVFSFLGRVALWSLLLLLALDNLGVDITALVAGFGIGGIAVALALQSVLGDLFAAFAIALDRPFSIGDFIIVDELLGTVEHVGLKTTRIRSLFGEQVAIANGDLLGSRIRNYKRMAERRAVFSLGVTYQTPAETLAAIPGLLREIVERQHPVRFDRAHFKTYGDFALIFEVVYYVLSPDYNLHMDIQHAINLEIYRRFAAAGIDFAYPTQTLYVHPVTVPGAAAPARSRP